MNSRCFWCSKALSGELLGDAQTHLACERAAWRSNRTNGFIIFVFFLPVAGVGFIAGCLFSAVKAGFSEGLGLWKKMQDFIRKPRP